MKEFDFTRCTRWLGSFHIMCLFCRLNDCCISEKWKLFSSLDSCFLELSLPPKSPPWKHCILNVQLIPRHRFIKLPRHLHPVGGVLFSPIAGNRRSKQGEQKANKAIKGRQVAQLAAKVIKIPSSHHGSDNHLHEKKGTELTRLHLQLQNKSFKEIDNS